jgi:hypothetical protein
MSEPPRLCPPDPRPAQKSLFGSVGYWHAPLFRGEAEKPAFQFVLFGKHDGAGGVMCWADVNVDGKATLKP